MMLAHGHCVFCCHKGCCLHSQAPATERLNPWKVIAFVLAAAILVILIKAAGHLQRIEYVLNGGCL